MKILTEADEGQPIPPDCVRVVVYLRDRMVMADVPVSGLAVELAQFERSLRGVVSVARVRGTAVGGTAVGGAVWSGADQDVVMAAIWMHVYRIRAWTSDIALSGLAGGAIVVNGADRDGPWSVDYQGPEQ